VFLGAQQGVESRTHEMETFIHNIFFLFFPVARVELWRYFTPSQVNKKRTRKTFHFLLQPEHLLSPPIRIRGLGREEWMSYFYSTNVSFSQMAKYREGVVPLFPSAEKPGPLLYIGIRRNFSYRSSFELRFRAEFGEVRALTEEFSDEIPDPSPLNPRYTYRSRSGRGGGRS